MSKTLTVLGNVTLIAVSYLPIQLIRISALALRVLGSYGEALSKRVRQFANKLHLVCVTHSVFNIRDVFIRKIEKDLLCPLRNVAQADVVWNGEDLKQSLEFLNQIERQIGERSAELTNVDLESLKKLRRN